MNSETRRARFPLGPTVCACLALTVQPGWAGSPEEAPNPPLKPILLAEANVAPRSAPQPTAQGPAPVQAPQPASHGSRTGRGSSRAELFAPSPPPRPGEIATAELGAGAASSKTLAGATQSFVDWRAGFRQRALSQGVDSGLFDRAFSGITPSARVLELDRFQPEFSRPLWEYLDRAVSETRISNGRRLAAEYATTMRMIEERHGVDGNIVLAIWGIESAYGADYGNIPVIRSLATLAHDGRRRGFAEQELLSALRILAAGDVTPERMVGSWAGAMGHTQFIPSSYLSRAVDFDGDGRRDVWAADPSDALASAANYLARAGWQRGAPAVVELRLPQGFDYGLAADGVRRDAAAWSALGITAIDGTSLPQGKAVEILIPAGSRGPAFAAYPNFRVIKRYNNATSYALAVAHLAERIGGGNPFVAGWPRADRPLARDEIVEIQRRLTSLGFDTRGTDGIIGPLTRAAVRRFQESRGKVPDGYVSATLLDEVRRSGS
ncbi:MAG: lytic murein transglycosylase [Pseudomonadota bacterium]